MSESAIRKPLKPLTRKQRDELERLAAMPDSEIDFSDAPEMVGGNFQPLKRPIAMQIDSDVLAWLLSKPDYQSRVNQILRDAMTAARK